MLEITIEQVAEISGGRLNQAASRIKDHSIEGVSIDTRTICAGNLFIPFLGENVDGHRFISDAFEKGAALSLSEHEMHMGETVPLVHVEDGLRALQDIARLYLEKVSPTVIAITGSNGKTTTKDMVECLLSPYFNVKKTIGNYNNEIGLPLTILEIDSDTEFSILELGMDARGNIDFLSRMTTPDVAIITNVGESHIEKLGSRENIAAAKYEIVNGLKDTGTFIYSRDYPLLERIVDKEVSYSVRTGGMDAANDLEITGVAETEDGTVFNISPIEGEIIIPQLGAHNAANATLALAAAEAAGLDMDEVKGHLAQLKVTDMRMEQLQHESGALIINDAYNASLSSMKSAIRTIEGMDYGYKILVLADILELGSHSEELHRSVGAYINDSTRTIDLLLTIGDEAKRINEVSDVISKRHFDSIEALSAALSPHLTKDAVVLLKGSRGMAVERVMEYI
ncbi:UDP-N-acetylmuramoyl-tripeptide--D-alanyl-D-alanine ligase [Salinicoccus albus]|uniref:UDP-N-acetylmuramoyl-tripeptide--D-alanyl-D- alanine ligase n=1 Tax=Salinicoccus albus TaxID=418756 RepID=UPI000361F546|nr:UDP-N-acetylmuramoyl-tripeptide--D-alanyl-D-alanine ligase [Salinicoccus albus]